MTVKLLLIPSQVEDKITELQKQASQWKNLEDGKDKLSDWLAKTRAAIGEEQQKPAEIDVVKAKNNLTAIKVNCYSKFKLI